MGKASFQRSFNSPSSRNGPVPKFYSTVRGGIPFTCGSILTNPPEGAALLSVDDADEVHPRLSAAGCDVTRGGSRAGFVDALAVRMVHFHIRARGDAGDLKGVRAGVGKNPRIDEAPVGVKNVGAVATVHPRNASEVPGGVDGYAHVVQGRHGHVHDARGVAVVEDNQRFRNLPQRSVCCARELGVCCRADVRASALGELPMPLKRLPCGVGFG